MNLKKIGKLCILATAALLSLAIIGCNAKSTVSKTVTVTAKGKAVTAAQGSKALEKSLSSGGIALNGEDVVLKAVDVTNSNSATFSATVKVDVPVAKPSVRLSATPAVGFVFDEWELDEQGLKLDATVSKKDVKLTDAQEESFTIEVDPEHVKFYVASFEPGYYINLENGSDSEGNGSYSKPFATISHALSVIDAIIQAGKTSSDEDDDYDEFVLVLSGSSTENVTINQEVGVSLKGGHASDWSLGQISSIGTLQITTEETDDIELSGLKISSLTAPSSLDEIELCEFGSLTISGTEPAVIANAVITGNATVASGSSFVNCTFGSASSISSGNHLFLHCIVGQTAFSTALVKSKNNIIVNAGGTQGQSSGNYVVTDRSLFEGNRTSDATLKAALMLAQAFTETEIEAFEDTNDIDDDYLEEDSTGFDRPEAEEGKTINCSYGPYEYIGRK